MVPAPVLALPALLVSVRSLTVITVTASVPCPLRTGLVLPGTGLRGGTVHQETGLDRGRRDGPRTVTGPRLTGTVRTVTGHRTGTALMTVTGLGAVLAVIVGTITLQPVTAPVLPGGRIP